jgi:hypothetical protein
MLINYLTEVHFKNSFDISWNRIVLPATLEKSFSFIRTMASELPNVVFVLGGVSIILSVYVE